MGNRSRALSRPRPEPGRPARSTAAPLSGTTGVVLDPIVSLRQRIRLRRLAAPCASVSRPGWRRIARPSEALARQVPRLPRRRRTFALAVTHAESDAAPSRHLRATTPCCSSGWRRACSAPHGVASRATPTRSPSNELGQPGLWPHAISGDLPILLVRVVGDDDMPLVRQVLQAPGLLAVCKGLRADVVIVNEHPVSYLDEMHAQLVAVLEDGPWSAWQHRPGGAYLLRADRMGRAGTRSCSRRWRARSSSATAAISRAQLDRPDAVRPPATPLATPALPPRADAAVGRRPCRHGR